MADDLLRSLVLAQATLYDASGELQHALGLADTLGPRMVIRATMRSIGMQIAELDNLLIDIARDDVSGMLTEKAARDLAKRMRELMGADDDGNLNLSGRDDDGTSGA